MDHSTSLTQHINASPEKVWAVISDIPGSAATLSGVESIQMVSEGPYGEGARWKETRSMMGGARPWKCGCPRPTRPAAPR